MKYLAIIVIAAGAIWSGVWYWARLNSDQATRDWFAMQQAAGWDASYDDLSITGFPNRVDRVFSDVSLSYPMANLVWRAPALHLLSLTYKPDHVIVAWPQTQTVTGPETEWVLTSQGLRSSHVSDAQGLLRLDAEAETLNFATTGGRVVAMADAKAAFHRQVDAPGAYRMAVTAAGVATNRAVQLPGSDAASALNIDATVLFDRPWGADAIHSARPNTQSIKIRLAEYKWGDMEIRLAGDLTVDSRGLATGDLTLQTRNWKAMLDAAVDEKILPEALAQQISASLRFLSSITGNSETLDVEFRVENGDVLIGPIGVGTLPKLTLP